ncbi:Acetokinase family-domain-containing protein [Lipomyces oligophaga]|uniref:Acetokinase family-domain-containing protein n=1 Tax=Lipomyces oligophaga TaxID=45792 RepID=UPI0034CE1E63
MKLILCLNAGSSSVKFSLFKYHPSVPLILSGQISGITAKSQFYDFTLFDEEGKIKEKVKQQQVSCPEHDSAFKFLIQRLQASTENIINSLDDIYLACHRVVHGGANSKPLVIDDSVDHELAMLSDLAPLHNQRALDIVHSCRSVLATTKNVAFFDSSFHMSIPKHIYTFPISLDVQKRHQLRKYGFHGLSYAFITSATSEYLGIPPEELNIIALHLGSGASACAIKNGQSLNTSMGLTPLEGLPGATRSGSIDPSLIFHYHSDSSRMSHALSQEMKLTVAEDILNKKSGWNSIAGTTDFGLITQRMVRDNDENAKLAFDMFVNRVSMYVGQYWVALEGKANALVFAGGIGEHSLELRAAVVEAVKCLGFTLDDELNARASSDSGAVSIVSPVVCPLKTLIVRTDEQVEMAKEAYQKHF